MYVRPLLWILLLSSLQQVFPEEDYGYDYGPDGQEPQNCSTAETIKGGHVTYSQGGLEDSVLTYHCDPGKYPYPVSTRTCSYGEWSTMRLPNGRAVSTATCKNMMCPAQLELNHGDFLPRDQWLPVGATQSFSCMEGFTLHGSAERNCTLTGQWTGTTPVCQSLDTTDDCNDPGIPPGAQRSSGHFHQGEKVIYRCQAGTDLLGSHERVCLENREWSGSAPRCQAPHIFDSPSAVAAAMTGSLAGVMDVFTTDAQQKGDGRRSFGRTFRVAEGSRMNVFILLDTSGSITKDDFDKSREATLALIRKLESYEVKMKFHVLSFASGVIDIVNITDSDTSSDFDEVVFNLMEFKYNSHGRKTGTNLHAALRRVREMIGFLKQNSARNHFNETQNIIVIETDGQSNTGSKPQVELAQIRNLLGYRTVSTDHTAETMLDVYVFGIGSEVKKEQLNALASKKRDEEHVFILKDYETLGVVFNRIISDKSVTMCGIAQEDSDGAYTEPWHVTVKAAGSCVGSIVSQHWVLTAAHCFARASTDVINHQALIKTGDVAVQSTEVIMHPNYNTRALRQRNVSEFYDYDIALVRVNKSIPLSWKARPICLPCTVAASRALKKVNSTCQQHNETDVSTGKELLPEEETAAFFNTVDSTRKTTFIQTGSRRTSCVEKAEQILKDSTVTLEEYVPERFLCSGGASGYIHDIACKGDSGGSLYLQNRKRFFQVGVVTWGTIDLCANPSLRQGNKPPPGARDFHIDLFKIMPWLKQHLGKEIQFLPEIN